jgi:hypothetical protein
MGRTTSILSTLIIGIALGMNFVRGLETATMNHILFALFLLNIVTSRDLTEKTVELGRQVARNLGLEGQVTALGMHHETTNKFMTYLEQQQELGKKIAERYTNPQNLSE